MKKWSRKINEEKIKEEKKNGNEPDNLV